MMLISDQDAAQLVDFAIRYTCLKLRVGEFGIFDQDVLLAMIAARDAEVHALLTDFVNSYKAWFEFHKEIDRAGKSGRLTDAETRNLMALSDRKDAARARFAERIHSIQ